MWSLPTAPEQLFQRKSLALAFVICWRGISVLTDDDGEEFDRVEIPSIC